MESPARHPNLVRVREMSAENKAWCPIFTPTFREHLLWWRTRHRSFAAVLELSVAKKSGETPRRRKTHLVAHQERTRQNQ